MKTGCLVFFSAMMALVLAACSPDAAVNTQLLSTSAARAPVITTTNPFKQMKGDDSGYIEVGGQCDVFVKGFEASFDGVFWDQIPATVSYDEDAGGITSTVTFQNDLDCRDGGFYFRATSASFPHLPAGDLQFILVRGLTDFGFSTSTIQFLPLPTPQTKSFLCFDDGVQAVKTVGDKVYIGGSFSLAGPCNGSAHLLDKSTGQLSAGDVFFDGSVTASKPDPLGTGIFAVGDFYQAGSARARKIARILPDGTVQGWSTLKFFVGIDEGPATLASLQFAPMEASGKYPLFVGGTFDTVKLGSSQRLDVTNLVKLLWDPVTGSLDIDSSFTTADVVSGSVSYYGDLLGSVHSIEVAPGVGPKGYLVAAVITNGGSHRVTTVRLDTGAVASGLSFTGFTLHATALDGNRIYLGGQDVGTSALRQYQMQTDGSLVSQSTTLSGFAFDPYVDGSSAIYALKIRTVAGINYLYVAGNFSAAVTEPAAQTVNALMKFNLTSGAAMAVTEVQTYLGAQSFAAVGTAVDFDDDGLDLALMKYGSAAPAAGETKWPVVLHLGTSGTGSLSPAASHVIGSLQRFGSKVFVGGAFTSFGVRETRRLVVTDRHSGAILAYVPAALFPSAFQIGNLEVSGTNIFVMDDRALTGVQSLYMVDLAATISQNGGDLLQLRSVSSSAKVQGPIKKSLLLSDKLVVLGAADLQAGRTGVSNQGTVVAVSLADLSTPTPLAGVGSEFHGSYADLIEYGGNIYGAGAAVITPPTPGLSCLLCPNTAQILDAGAFGVNTLTFARRSGDTLYVGLSDPNGTAGNLSFQVFTMTAGAWAPNSSALEVLNTPDPAITDVVNILGATFIAGNFNSFDGYSSGVSGFFVLDSAFEKLSINGFDGGGTRRMFADTVQDDSFWGTRGNYGGSKWSNLPRASTAETLSLRILPREYFE
jgi:hypothetical protein